VNYYPDCKKRTAYVAGTAKGKKHCTPEEAVEMAFSAPAVVTAKVKRKNNSRARRYRLLKKKPFCHWCNASLTLDNSTLEHKIPLKRGGLDHSNNWVLACPKCNHERGHEMPELEQQGALK
jgi:5-methylcytosine-specific restriction endonuclease McrA